MTSRTTVNRTATQRVIIHSETVKKRDSRAAVNRTTPPADFLFFQNQTTAFAVPFQQQLEYPWLFDDALFLCDFRNLLSGWAGKCRHHLMTHILTRLQNQK